MNDRPQLLRAGALSAELVGADLRMVRMRGVEIVRRMTTALRDTDWGTARATVESISVDEEDDGFTVHATVRHDLPEGSFRHSVAILGTSDGRLSYRICGAALQPLRTNRVGLCVLVPPCACEGRAYRCERDTGEVESDRFPDTVMPQSLLANGDDRPPLAGIRKLTLDAGGAIAFAFEGPPFCLEDQRNWTDASYKCCPEDPPELPVVLEPVDAVAQGVVVSSTLDAVGDEAPTTTRVTLGEVTGTLPSIGPAGSAAELARLTGLPRPAFAHLELYEANELDPPAATRLELEVPPASRREHRGRGPLSRRRCPRTRRRRRSERTPRARGRRERRSGETRGCRRRRSTRRLCRDLDLRSPFSPTARALWWSICPQIHADDDRTILENTTCQDATVRAARRLAPDARLSVTLRFAPAGADDPRASGATGAAWLAASIASLAAAGVDAISVAASMLGEGAGSTPAAVMRLFAARAGAGIRVATVTDELAVAALGLEVPGRGLELLLVNLRDEPAGVAIVGCAAGSIPRAEQLNPYEVRIVELGGTPIVLNETQGATA